jgi:hypothetical protein
VEFARVKSYRPAHVTLRKSLRFAVEKTKLWFVDEDGKEYETKVLKTAPRGSSPTVTQVSTPQEQAHPEVQKAAATDTVTQTASAK